MSSNSSLEHESELPRGLMFTDTYLLENLDAQCGSGEPHKDISKFIRTFEDGAEVIYKHPEKLPGAKKDGSIIYFFHPPPSTQKFGKRKRYVFEDQGEAFRWRQSGRPQPLNNGGHEGWKIVMTLYKCKGSENEKTNWVRHQYHLGKLDAESTSPYVVSKIYYQQRQQKISGDPQSPKDGNLQKNSGATPAVPDPQSSQGGILQKNSGAPSAAQDPKSSQGSILPKNSGAPSAIPDPQSSQGGILQKNSGAPSAVPDSQSSKDGILQKNSVGPSIVQHSQSLQDDILQKNSGAPSAVRYPQSSQGSILPKNSGAPSAFPDPQSSQGGILQKNSGAPSAVPDLQSSQDSILQENSGGPSAIEDSWSPEGAFYYQLSLLPFPDMWSIIDYETPVDHVI